MRVSLNARASREDNTAGTGGPPLGQILLGQRRIEEAQLSTALHAQRDTGCRLGSVLVARGWTDADAVAGALAEQWGLGFVDLAFDPPEAGLADPADLEIYLSHRLIPWRRLGTLTTYAIADPSLASEGLGKLGNGGGMAFFVVATTAQIDQAILNACGPRLAEAASTRTPEDQSVRSLGWLRLVVALGLAAVAVGILAWGSLLLPIFAVPLLLLTVATTALRLAALYNSGTQELDRPKRYDGTVPLADKRPPPTISILVPLYREAEMIDEIISSLRRLDYPRELLDVKLLLEADDEMTREALDAARLPAWISVLVVPDGAPRTKPRAMNVALDFCDGEVIGILDAEDRPASEQLRDVAEMLRNAPPDVACVQCQLSYYNAHENWITRCFQIEYSIWFDVLLRGFQRLGLPIPLGGTSVYFRRSSLRDLGAWDAHNVTEDADLGMRLARRGMRCAVVKSTTLEEANCRVGPWIRQRSRWLKGYLVTWMNHMRAPRRLWRELGPKGFVGLNLLFLGGAVSYLAMPLFWLALFHTMVTGQSLFGDAFDETTLTVFAVLLAAGQAVMVACAAVAMLRRRSIGLLAWVPSLPLYWTLGAVAAWKAVIELIAAPYYWDKTRHGVSRFLRTRHR